MYFRRIYIITRYAKPFPVVSVSNLLLFKTRKFLQKLVDVFSKHGTVTKNFFLSCVLDEFKS